MNFINSRLYSIFIISLAVGIGEIFAPDGKIKEYLRYLFALISLCVLFSPIISVLKEIPSLCRQISEIANTELSGEYSAYEDNRSDEILIQSGKEAIEKHTRELIYENFRISSDKTTVTAFIDSSDKDNIRLIGMTIIADKEYKNKFSEIEKYVGAYYGIGVTVTEREGAVNENS